MAISDWRSSASGKVQFDAVRLCRVVAVHRQIGPFLLGEGESIRDGKYAFQGAFKRCIAAGVGC